MESYSIPCRIAEWDVFGSLGQRKLLHLLRTVQLNKVITACSELHPQSHPIHLHAISFSTASFFKQVKVVLNSINTVTKNNLKELLYRKLYSYFLYSSYCKCLHIHISETKLRYKVYLLYRHFWWTSVVWELEDYIHFYSLQNGQLLMKKYTITIRYTLR